MLEGVLWGLKTKAFLDVWSIEHFITGITLGSLVAYFTQAYIIRETNLPPRIARYLYFISLVAVAYLWEAIEFYLEVGLLGSQVKYWFQGVEFWANRLISDVLLVLAGGWLYLKLPKISQPARLFSFMWLFFHIAIFPHSMYLHTVSVL